MTNKINSSPATPSKASQQEKIKQDKQDRLSQALRDNLFKRKAQARARAAQNAQKDNKDNDE